MLIWRLLQRLILGRLRVRYGEVGGLKEMYYLRGVLTFVAVFAATVALPALLLAWYGFQGIRAEQRAGTAEVERVGELAAAAAVAETERYFSSFEDAVLNRLKSGESLYTSIGELSDALRVVYRFGGDGELQSPFRAPDGGEIEPDDDQILFSAPGAMDAWRTGARDAAASLPLYARARQQARGDRAAAALLIQHAHMLLQTGDNAAADADYLEALQRYGDLRDGYGFRIGDIARLKRGEILLGQDPVAAQAQLQGLVEELMAIDWVIGRGGEAAIARRVLDLLAPRSDADWLARMRSRIAERSAQHCVAGQLQGELDSLGAKGRLLKVSAGQFSYIRTENALWAITWTEADQYVMALDLRAVLSRLAWQSARTGGPDSEVRVEVVGPEEELGAAVVARRSLAPWLSGWSVQVWPRDPAALATRQQEQWRRGVFIVGVSVVMIGLGALLSARLLQRELDAAREKADFAARVSHELRSPITQIRLKAEALLLGLATSEEARNRHYEIIMRESERLSRLVDNMLDFAAIERGLKKYSMRPGDLSATVIRAVESAQVAMEMAGIEIALELPEDLPAVNHDPDAVSQAIANLLSNAAKYGGPLKGAGKASGSAPGNTGGKPPEPAEGATPWIGVSVRVVDTDKVREVWVEVSDRGIGIAPEEQAKIFEQYYRSSDPQARRRKGTGLGLTIVRYILEAHHGRVSVRSMPGQGSTFILQFPTDL